MIDSSVWKGRTSIVPRHALDQMGHILWPHQALDRLAASTRRGTDALAGSASIGLRTTAFVRTLVVTSRGCPRAEDCHDERPSESHAEPQKKFLTERHPRCHRLLLHAFVK